MKKKIFMACAALVVSAAAVVGVKAYDHLQMTDAWNWSGMPCNHISCEER